MFYSIRHLTKFLYDQRRQREHDGDADASARSDQNQRCLTFHLSVSPRCRPLQLSRPTWPITSHHFDTSGAAPAAGDRRRIAGGGAAGDRYSFLPGAPTRGPISTRWSSRATTGSSCFRASSRRRQRCSTSWPTTWDVQRRDDPLMLLHELNGRLYDYFDYKPRSTKVDSPIDVALESRQGVCQDFAHIMITLNPHQAEDAVPLRQRLLGASRARRHGFARPRRRRTRGSRC